jgi:DNA-binding CsgD family transcriptional regulator
MTERPSGTPAGEDDLTLKVLGTGFRQAFDAIGLAVYVLDADGTVRWINKAAAGITGSRIGESYLHLIAPEHRARGKMYFARTVVGGTASEFALTVVGRGAALVDLRIHAAPLRQHSTVVGAIGIAMRLGDQTRGKSAPSIGASPDLTPRQEEVLQLLAEGLDTREIARRLGVAVETARNHIRALFRRLEVHSRLEAVIAGRRHGLLGEGNRVDPGDDRTMRTDVEFERSDGRSS